MKDTDKYIEYEANKWETRLAVLRLGLTALFIFLVVLAIALLMSEEANASDGILDSPPDGRSPLLVVERLRESGRTVRPRNLLIRFIQAEQALQAQPTRDPNNPYVVHCIPGTDINGDGKDDFCSRTDGHPKHRP